MADTITVTCPKCLKSMAVPSKLAGKKVRCKGCEAIVAVAAKDTFKFADEDTPRQKKAVAVAAKPKPKVEEEENANPYGVTADDSHIPRCAFCAKELDPPDSRVCKNCGFDLLDRRRHESKAVYELTIGDYLNHHALTILAFLGILTLIGIDVYLFANMDEWFQGSFMELDEKDPTTGKPKYWVGPGFVLCWATIIFLAIGWYAARFIHKKLTKELRPREQLTST